jgi:hypothetical protein
MADAEFGFDFDHAAGTLTSEEQRQKDANLHVTFSEQPMLDGLLTDGGVVLKRHPKVKEAEKLGLTITEYEEDDKYVVIEPAGRQVYRRVEFIRIIIPGSRDNIIEKPLEPDYKARFADRYARWKKGEESGAIGTPIKEIPFIDCAMREELAYFGVHTAEQLLGMPEPAAQKFMGVHTLQEKVKRWMSALQGDATKNYERDLQAKEAEMAAMRQALAELQSQLASLGAKPTLPDSKLRR